MKRIKKNCRSAAGWLPSCLLLLLLICMVGTVRITVLANDDKIVDQADLLSDEEEARLEEQFTAIVEEYDCDVAVVTVDSCEGKAPQTFADDYYEENGYGYGTDMDGLLFMVSMEERDWSISTHGAAITIFTDYGLEQLEHLFLEDLSDGNYYEAFQSFGTAAEQFMKEARDGEPYDVAHRYKQPMSIGLRLLISVCVGLVLAGLVLAGLFWQLKSVGAERNARDYVRDGSFQVTRANDLFLYRTVQRRKIEKQPQGGGGSSTHTTSSGGSAGGRSGKF